MPEQPVLTLNVRQLTVPSSLWLESPAHVSLIVPGCQFTNERYHLLRESLHICLERLELQHEQFDSGPMKLDNPPRYRFVAANQPRCGSAIRSNAR
jgi:hypothetical protein